MGLGSIAADALATSSLKDLIKANLREARDKPPLTADDYLRMSSIADICPREEVICSVDGIVRKKTYNADTLLTFNHGHGIHHALQQLVLPDIGVLMGKWRCETCKAIYGAKEEGKPLCDTVVPKPQECDHCDGEVFDEKVGVSYEFAYQEMYFLNEKFRVGGHCDGFLRIPGLPGIGVFEGKSISPRGAWEIRHVPKFNHVVQTQGYMWLTDVKWAIVLYWDKGAYGLKALTEHFVARDYDTIKALQDTITSIWAGVKGGALPERICQSADCERAGECKVVKPCFAR
jgi:hypothetical protein